MKTFEELLEKHCNIVYNRHTGDKEIKSSMSSVAIAMEEYLQEELKKCKNEQKTKK